MMANEEVQILPLPWLRFLQVIYLALTILTLSKFSWSTIIYYRAANEICTADITNCHNRFLPTQQDVVSLQTDSITLKQWAVYQIAYRSVVMIVFSGVSFIIFVKKKHNPATLIISLAMLLFGTIGFNGTLIDRYPQFSLLFNFFLYLTYISFQFFFFTFPTGKIVPNWLWLIILISSIVFGLDFTLNETTKANVFYQVLSNLVWFSIFLGGSAVQVYRYRQISNTAERQQTKWVVTGITLWAGLVLISFSVPSTRNLTDISTPYSAKQMLLLAPLNLASAIIPITIVIAIMRYRLWDIDLIIRRTLQYSLLTGLLSLVFFGGGGLLQALLGAFGGQSSPLIIVLTTLLIAALFNPLRLRLQSFIDRRFYRQKYDAEKALAEFADGARSETDLRQLSNHLTLTVQSTLHPQTISLWMQPTHARRKPDE